MQKLYIGPLNYHNLIHLGHYHPGQEVEYYQPLKRPLPMVHMV